MGRMISPTRGSVSSEYGIRNGTLHAGMDIATGRESRPVLFPFRKGIIEHCVWGRGRGNTSRRNEVAPFRTGDGFKTRTPDNERQLFNHTHPYPEWRKPGTRVFQGDLMGETNLSGITTGEHLHYEEWLTNNSNRTRNPRASFRAFGVTPGAAAPAPGWFKINTPAGVTLLVRTGPSHSAPVKSRRGRGYRVRIRRWVFADGRVWGETFFGNWVAREFLTR